MFSNHFSRLAQASIASAVFVAGLLTTVSAQAPTTPTFTGLASFNGTDGYEPNHTALIQATDGNLYGTTSYGGGNGQGTVFRITLSGKLTAIYSFCSLAKCADGANPYTSLVQAGDGDLYGTAYAGGANGQGTFFKITTGGTLTTLHNFCSKTNCTDGAGPEGQLIQDTAGNYYGTTYAGGANGDGTVFRITPSGVLTTLHSFNGTDGTAPQGGVIEVNGLFYGTTSAGGTEGDGTVFEMTTAGVVATLHYFVGKSEGDGSSPYGWMVQASNGNLYGTTLYGGKNGLGSVFEITLAGKLTTLHSFCSQTGCADGSYATAGLIQATDGNLYGLTGHGGADGDGTIYKITQAGVLTTLHGFDGSDGNNPIGGLVQDTNGDFYGMTEYGGADGDGTVFSLSVGLASYITLQSTSGTVGSRVGILGQGFDSASVVKFNGVKATKITLTGTTYITATVPAGATDGKVTVTTGTTTLTSTQTFTVHNSWSSGAAVPTARMGAFVGAIGTNVYVIGGLTPGGFVDVNEIYNTVTNKWITGTPDPNPRWAGASAVVNGILYLIGGSNGSYVNLVEAFDPVTKTWSTKAPMPTIRQAASAAVDKNIIYVIGGENTSGFLDTVESYNTTTNTWSEEAPLSIAKGWAAVGLLGATVVAADGGNSSTHVGDNEGYNVSLNKWTTLTDDPTPRGNGCFSAIGGQLYVAGGSGKNGQLSLNEAYSSTKNSWTTLAPMPKGVNFPGSAEAGGRLYCFGGGIYPSAAYNYLQIYQP